MDKDKLPKIVAADATAIDALEVHVNEFLKCLGELLGQPGIESAWVSDESLVSDFLETKKTGKKSPHPFDTTKTIDVVTSKTPKNKKILAQLSEKLGVEVKAHDFVYEVAIRLRDF